MTDTVNVERDALVDQINALVAIPDSSMSKPIPFLARDLLTKASVALAAAPKAEPVGVADELDLYDDKVQAGISWALNQVGLSLGLSLGEWDGGDGSESVEGDVGCEIENTLVAAKLRDPETGALATLQPEAPKVEQEPWDHAVRYRDYGWGYASELDAEQRELVLQGLPFWEVRPLYTHPAPASDELLEALEPFARYYDLNDCHERQPDDALEVPISDLARAANLIAQHKGPQS